MISPFEICNNLFYYNNLSITFLNYHTIEKILWFMASCTLLTQEYLIRETQLAVEQ